MTPTTGYATKEELYQVKQELSKRIGDLELHLSLHIGKVHTNVDNLRTDMDTRFDEVRAEARRVEQNMMSMFAALFAHLGIDTPPLHE